MVLSDDARYVTYRAGETYDLWQFDRSTGETTRITEGDRDTLGFFASGDGRSVLFTSDATDLVEGQVGGPRDAYFWDRDTGTITSLTGRTPNVAQRFHYAEALSADGRYAVFSSDEPLMPGVTDQIRNLYMWDRVSGETTAITDGNGGSGGSSELIADETVGVLDLERRAVRHVLISSDRPRGRADCPGIQPVPVGSLYRDHDPSHQWRSQLSGGRSLA